MRKLILLPLLFTCASAYAVPNVWDSEFGQGNMNYYIYDSKDRLLRISCNSGAGLDYDPYVTLEIGNKTYQNTDSKYPLSLLLDNKKAISPPGSTGSVHGSNSWNKLVEGISKARKIDVYLNNKKLTTFTPPKPNVDEVAIEIADCSI